MTTKTEQTKTEAEKIWEEIRNLPIMMFGLPNQIVSMHCTPKLVEPNTLYVITRSSAVLPSLEEVLGSKYVVELAAGYLTVKRAPKTFTPKK